MKCKDCKYCEQPFRQQSQCGKLGRKCYYCEHPKTATLKDEFGHPLHNFIGFGDMTPESPLTLKNCKRWCPLKGE